MAAHLTPGEQAVADATPAWRALPTTVARAAELRAVAATLRHLGDADAITALNRAFADLDRANPIPDVHQALADGLV